MQNDQLAFVNLELLNYPRLEGEGFQEQVDFKSTLGIDSPFFVIPAEAGIQ